MKASREASKGKRYWFLLFFVTLSVPCLGSDSDAELASKSVSGLVVGTIVAPIATVLVGYLKEALESRKGRSVVREASLQTAFWRAHFQAQSQVLTGDELGEARKLVSMQLSAIAQTVVSAEKARAERRISDWDFKRTLRNVLLLYKPPSKWFWVLRVYYYYLLVGPIVFVTIRLNEDAATPSFGADWRVSLLILGLVCVIYVAWTAGVWWFIRYREDRSRHRMAI